MRKLFLAILALIIISPEVNAVVFSVSPLDRSLKYLSTIFGSKVGTINLTGADTAQTLQMMFEHFNTIVLTVGITVVSYIGIVSTINTAREGEAMGKKWNTMWIPMRAVLGMLLMIPSPGSGYSMIQTVVMWIVLQGVGAANEIWDVFLDNILAGRGGVAGAPALPEVSQTNYKTMMQELLKAAVCKNLLNTRDPDKIANRGTDKVFADPVDFYPKTLADAAVSADGNPAYDESSSTSTALGEVSIGTPDFTPYCGYIKFTAKETVGVARSDLTSASPVDIKKSDTNDLATDAWIAKLSGLRVVFNALDFLGAQIAAVANEKLLAVEEGRVPPDTEYSIPGEYTNVTYGMYQGEVSVLQAPVKSGVDAETIALANQARIDGWIMAGQYYKLLSTSAVVEYNPDIEQNLPQVLDVPSTAGKNLMSPELLKEWEAIEKYINDLFNGMSNSNFSALDLASMTLPAGENGKSKVPFLDSVMEALLGISSSVDYWMNSIAKASGDNPSGDPIVNIASLGNNLMVNAERAWMLLMVSSALTAALSYTCASMNPAGYAFTTGFGVAAAAILSAIAMLWGIGATLGIYVPMIPYMIFTVAALGWMVAVVEAIVAAPILALGFVSPSADELGKTSHGISILANIFLRPMLMIFGFMLGAKFLRAAIYYVNMTFNGALERETNGGTMFSWVIPISIYMSLVMALVSKCFALIHILPDKIMRWIGGQVEQTDMGAMQDVKQGADSANKEAVNVQQGAKSSAMGNASKNVQGDRKEANKAKKAKESGGGGGGGGGAPQTPPSFSGPQSGGGSFGGSQMGPSIPGGGTPSGGSSSTH